MRKYGTSALASVMKEVNQLHDKGVRHPVKYEKMRQEKNDKQSNLLKSQEDRLMADGRMQD